MTEIIKDFSDQDEGLFSKALSELISESKGTQISVLASQLESAGFANSSFLSILSSSTCQTLNSTILPELFRGNFETKVYPDEWHWREGISRPEATREICNSWKSSRMIASIVLNEKLGEFIAKIMNWDSIRIAQDDIVWKPPSSLLSESNEKKRIDTVGFHQDSAYISSQFQPYSNNSVTLWMALDDADEGNGCLEYAVGSQKWKPILHHGNNSSFHDSDESSYRDGLSLAHASYLKTLGQEADQVVEFQKAPVKAGHAVLHHQDVWHGSGPNLSSTRHRRALVAHYIRGDVKFINTIDETFPPFGKTSYIYGRYKKYKSSEVDETFFPITYANPETSDMGRTEWIDDYIHIQK